MNTELSNDSASRGKITWLMVLCGIVGVAAACTAGAATSDDATPSIAVHYDPQRLATDEGARSIYHTLERAAEQVCPDIQTGSRLVRPAVIECRRQAVARAVNEINNARLAAVYSSSTKRG